MLVSKIMKSGSKAWKYPIPAYGRKQAGFTLVELLITIVILGILASLAIPSFREFVAGQRIKTASFDMMAMLTLARSEAIKRGANVSISASSTHFTVSADSGTTVLLQQEIPAGVTITGWSAVTYNRSGRLGAAFTPVQISSTSSSQVRCLSIDLSGRPNTKNTAC